MPRTVSTTSAFTLLESLSAGRCLGALAAHALYPRAILAARTHSAGGDGASESATDRIAAVVAMPECLPPRWSTFARQTGTVKAVVAAAGPEAGMLRGRRRGR